jgi:type I restriction enzyme, S subunit
MKAATKKAWQTKKLGEVLQKTTTVNPFQTPDAEFDYIDVSSVSNATFQIESIQRLKGKDAPSRARKLVRTNDILFATIRPTLQRIAVVPEHLDKQVCSTGYFVLRPTPEIDHRFVFYFLFTEDFTGQMQTLQKGASYPAVTDGDVKAQEILVPPLPEQQRIVGILDEAFEGIATAKANAEENLQNARALFQSTYVALVAESDGWLRTTVADVALPQKGSIRTGPFGSQLLHGEFLDEGVAVLGIDNAVNNEFRWGKVRCITAAKFRELSRYQVKPGDVLITIMGTCGRCAIVPDDIPTAINTKHLCCITLNPNKCAPGFLHAYFLHHPIAQQFLVKRAKGSIMAGLNMGIIKELPILLPTLLEQKAIVKTLNELREETHRLEFLYKRKLAALQELKKSLLLQAFTGKL